MGVAVGPEYRLQPEANKGLQARDALFSLKKGVVGTGLKPLDHFRLKAVLRPPYSALLYQRQAFVHARRERRVYHAATASTCCHIPVFPLSFYTPRSYDWVV
jgi:hypothetical protein